MPNHDDVVVGAPPLDQPLSITRRKALLATGAMGAVAALTGVRSVQAASGESDDAVTGTWDVTVTSATNAQPPFSSLVGFAAGGTLVTTNNQNPGNVSLGGWEHEGSHGFKAIFHTFAFDPTTGNFAFTVVVRAKGKVDDDRISGTYSVEFLPGPAGFTPPPDHGTFAGSRLEP